MKGLKGGVRVKGRQIEEVHGVIALLTGQQHRGALMSPAHEHGAQPVPAVKGSQVPNDHLVGCARAFVVVAPAVAVEVRVVGVARAVAVRVARQHGVER